MLKTKFNVKLTLDFNKKKGHILYETLYLHRLLIRRLASC